MTHIIKKELATNCKTDIESISVISQNIVTSET